MPEAVDVAARKSGVIGGAVAGAVRSRGSLPRLATKRTAVFLGAAAIAALVAIFFLSKAFLPGLPGLTFVNEAAFPDEGFRTFVSEKVDLDGNGILTPGERNAVQIIDLFSEEASADDASGSSSLKGTVSAYEEKNWAVEDISAQPISLEGSTSSQNANCGLVSSLEGINCFKALRVLNCSGLGLSELDLSGNPNLEYVSCLDNNIQSLDLSKNAELTTLYCDTDVTLDGLGDAGLYFTELPVEIQEISSDGDANMYQVSYDSFGRMRDLSYAICYSDGIMLDEFIAVYGYDESGRLIRRDEHSGQITQSSEYGYDDAGRLASYSLDYGDTTLNFTYEYDDAGRLMEENSALADPSIYDNVTSCDNCYDYNEGGTPSSCERILADESGDQAIVAIAYSYDEAGLMESMTFGELDGEYSDFSTIEKLRSEAGILQGERVTNGGDDGSISWATECNEDGFLTETVLTYSGSPIVAISYEVDANGYVVGATYDDPDAVLVSWGDDGASLSAEYVKRIGSLEDRSSSRYLPSFDIDWSDGLDSMLLYYESTAYMSYPLSAVEQGPELQPRREAGLLETVISNPNERMLEAYDKALFS